MKLAAGSEILSQETFQFGENFDVITSDFKPEQNYGRCFLTAFKKISQEDKNAKRELNRQVEMRVELKELTQLSIIYNTYLVFKLQ